MVLNLSKSLWGKLQTGFSFILTMNSLPSRATHFFLLVAALGAFDPLGAAEEELFQVPIRIHLIDDLSMSKKGVEMTNWITAEVIQDTVMPELNRIWSKARIEWTLRGVGTEATRSNGREETVEYVLNATRDSQGKADPERVKKLRGIFKTELADPNAVNIYVIPYLGGTSQGVASPNRKRVVIGQWTDKPSHGLRPPERCLLVEPGEFQQGSFSRTLGHELGHILGLPHPAKGTPPFGRLMGGSQPGNELTHDEISVARQGASNLIAEFKQP